jgi:hypothetical protein
MQSDLRRSPLLLLCVLRWEISGLSNFSEEKKERTEKEDAASGESNQSKAARHMLLTSTHYHDQRYP